MSTAAIHAACLLLVALDFVVRTWRTQLFLRGLGHPLPFREVFVQSALGETASSLTPLRAGGEPARVWAMVRMGVPSRIAVVSIGLELLAVFAIIIVVALVLAVTVAPDWWAVAGPHLVHSTVRSWPWLVAVALVSVIAWLVTRRARPELLHAARDELAVVRGHVRDVPLRVYAANVPLTLLNIAARVAILPVLALAMTDPPPLVATLVGSFALLNVQGVLPTPAGAGAVEIGFLAGAAGNLGAAEAALLVQWRIYTTVLGAALGAVLALARFHGGVIPKSVRSRRAETDDV